MEKTLNVLLDVDFHKKNDPPDREYYKLPENDDILFYKDKDHPQISFIIPDKINGQYIDKMAVLQQALEQAAHTDYSHYLDSGRWHRDHNITQEQISNSAVLNLADLKNDAINGLENFFAGIDMHSWITYLWIGIVAALIVLTVIFVLFSCYFYRKFREWKKYNKDIRANCNGDVFSRNSTDNPEAAYYQVESPPCYTIASGLPTYDEALHNNQKHFDFGMKFIYPTLAAVHHQASNLISSWERFDNTSNDEKSYDNSVITKCKTAETQDNLSKALLLSPSLTLEASTDTSPTSALLLPPSYEEAALLPKEVTTTCDNVAITVPQLVDTCASVNCTSELTDIITL